MHVITISMKEWKVWTMTPRYYEKSNNNNSKIPKRKEEESMECACKKHVKVFPPESDCDNSDVGVVEKQEQKKIYQKIKLVEIVV